MSLPAMYPEAPVMAILSGVSLIGEGIGEVKTESAEAGNIEGHADFAGGLDPSAFRRRGWLCSCSSPG